MAIGIQDEHEDLRAAVRGWAEAHGVGAAVRLALDAEADALPPYWDDLAGQGLVAVHLPEELGGQGAGTLELAVVAEELGRAAAVGPWDTTAVVAGNPASSDIASAHASPANHRHLNRSLSTITHSHASGSHAAASTAPRCSACEAV